MFSPIEAETKWTYRRCFFGILNVTPWVLIRGFSPAYESRFWTNQHVAIQADVWELLLLLIVRKFLQETKSHPFVSANLHLNVAFMSNCIDLFVLNTKSTVSV